MFLNIYFCHIDVQFCARNQSGHIKLNILLELDGGLCRNGQSGDHAVYLAVCDAHAEYLAHSQVEFRIVGEKATHISHSNIHNVAVIFNALHCCGEFLKLEYNSFVLQFCNKKICWK